MLEALSDAFGAPAPTDRLDPQGDGPVRVGVLVFHGVEILDFAGPLEVLSALGCITIGEASEVTCQGGLRIVPDRIVADDPPIDVLVVPGGPGTRRPEGETQPLVEYIRRRAGQARIVAGVCTGAFFLGRAGLLDGRRATTHRRWKDALAQRFPTVALTDGRTVDDGHIVTSAGVSAGIDLGLLLLARLQGAQAARHEAQRIEWPGTAPEADSG